MGVLPFVSKLLLGRQLNFDKGRLSVFGQRVIIVPVELIQLLIQKGLEDEKFEDMIYDAMKNSVYIFCENLKKNYNMKSKDLENILVNLAEMNGYGELQITKIDYEKKIAVYHMRGLPSKSLFGKIKSKKKVADRYWAGMLAGGAMSILGDKNIEAVEIICDITGKEHCEFVAGSKESIKEYVKKYGTET